ncbi:hypothetical protein N9C48_01685 [bacterium]|jgi:predicted component of type VI protein secretion system|nr:hypothetical protein [bacterium]
MNKKTNTILATVALLTLLQGCASVPEYLQLDNANTYGYRDYDVCVRCGEEPVFINIDQTKEAKEYDSK